MESTESASSSNAVNEQFFKALGSKFLKRDGSFVNVERDFFKDKIIGIYFSAHWCPPCRAFTPELTKTYNKLIEEGKKMEIIFVSSDSTEKEFEEYFHEMGDWLAIAFSDPRKNVLGDMFSVRGIPSLMIIDGNNGSVITNDGRTAVLRDTYPFKNTPNSTMSGLNPVKFLLIAGLIAYALHAFGGFPLPQAFAGAAAIAMLLR